MNKYPTFVASSSVAKASAWLTPRRIRLQAIILACCLWGACAADFSTAGVIDRAGNIKFQDFLQFYISARMIAQGRSSGLYNQNMASTELLAVIERPTAVRLPTVYGPQVGLFFTPLARLHFLTAAAIWVAISGLLFCICMLQVWRICPNLGRYPDLVALGAVCFPPLFHCFVRGQISAPILACFTLALLSFRTGNEWLAGAVIGLLVFKPQFLVAIPLLFVLASAWRALAGLTISAFSQLALTWMYFGAGVMRAYFDTLLHVPRWISSAEPGTSQAQMHSLRSFWILLIPSPTAALALYVASAIFILVIAADSWRARGPLALRFAALSFAAVLINPHLFVYDLLMLAPALLLLADWALAHASHPASPAMNVLLYLAFLLPLFGPLTVWTHFQLSVPVFIGIQMLIWTILRGRAPIWAQRQ